MPTHHRFWGDEQERFLPPRPQLSESHPEHLVERAQSSPRSFGTESQQLLTQSVAAILLATYSEKLRASLELLMAESEKLSVAQFAGSLIDRIAGFAQERPAWLNLHAASIHYRRDPAARRALRSTIRPLPMCFGPGIRRCHQSERY